MHRKNCTYFSSKEKKKALFIQSLLVDKRAIYGLCHDLKRKFSSCCLFDRDNNSMSTVLSSTCSIQMSQSLLFFFLYSKKSRHYENVFSCFTHLF